MALLEETTVETTNNGAGEKESGKSSLSFSVPTMPGSGATGNGNNPLSFSVPTMVDEQDLMESANPKVSFFDIGKPTAVEQMVEESASAKKDPDTPKDDLTEGELPYFAGPYDAPKYQEEKELVQDKPTGPARAAMYTAQEAVRGVTGMADIATAVIDATPGIGWAKYKMGQYFGAYDKDKPYQFGVGNAIENYGSITQKYDKQLPAVYDALGYDKVDKIKAESGAERALGFAAENLGAFAPIKLGQALIRGARGTSTALMDGFTKSELLASGTGAAAGGVAWSMFDTEESKEQAGYLGNFVGSLFPMVKDLHWLSMIKKHSQNAEMRADGVVDMSSRLINQDIARIVPAQDIPMIEERIRKLRAFQELEPEFTVTASSLVRTPHARSVQAWVDNMNPEMATEIYEKNNSIVSRWIQKHGAHPDSENVEAIQEAVMNVAAQGERVTETYIAKIASLEDEIKALGRTSATTDPAEVGKAYRQQITDLEKEMGDHVASLYKKVDPENKVRVPMEDVYNLLNEARKNFVKGTHTQSINYDTDPGKHLLSDIQKMLAKFNPEEAGTSNVRIKFNKIVDFRKAFDTIARNGYSIEGGSQAGPLANQLARALDGMLDDMAENGDEMALGAYAAARASYRDYYLPHFLKEDNIITKHIATYSPNGIDYKIAADKLIRTIWQEGSDPTEINAQQLNKMLTDATDIVDPEALAVARETIEAKVSDFALSSLNREIREATNPEAAFTRWTETNEVNLKNFPFVKQTVEEIGRDLSLKKLNIQSLMEQKSYVNATLIKRYSEQDAEKLIPEIGRMSEAQAVKTMKELMFGAGVKSPYINLPFGREEMMNNLSDFSPTVNAFLKKLEKEAPDAYLKASSMRQAISEEILHRIIRKGVSNDAYGGLDAAYFNSIFNGNNEQFNLRTLKQIMEPEDYATIEDFHTLANATRDMFSGSGRLDIDILTRMERSMGLSLSSVSARIYAQQLGKVGPVYIISDTGAKLLKAAHGHKLQKQLANTVYDINALEEVIKYRKKMASGEEAEVFAEQLGKLEAIKYNLKNGHKLFISKSGKFLKKKFFEVMANPSVGMSANKLMQYMDSEERGDNPITSPRDMIQIYQTAYGEKTAPARQEDWDAFLSTLNGPLDDEEDDLTIEEEVEEPQGKAPEGTADGVYEDAQGNRVRVEGGNTYGL